jgi:nucleoside-diphosphate-sugar epimerase
MNIWITGSTGFIGSHLLKNLEDKGHEVTCFSNNLELLKKRGKGINVNYLDFSSKTDIRDYIIRLGCPQKFIHLGWGDMTVPMSKLHLTKNVEISNNLIESLLGAGIEKFIFVGSMNEYGSRTGSLSEDMEPEGRVINYAKGKLEVSEFGFKRADFYKKVFIHTRPFYVFGPGQREGSLINDLFSSYTKGKEPVLGPCNYYRDYIYVKDVAEGITRSMNIETSTKINLGMGSYIMVKDFVKTFWSMLGRDGNELKFGSKKMMKDEPDQPKSYANITKLVQLTEWKPEYTIEDGIKETISILEKKEVN